ncbi:MAG: rRNA adenine dimethyltransferase family protein, partial [Candidatus Saccharimonadales bacterium]
MAKKSLGQHWLTDEPALKSICDSADLKPGDTVLEIGPGLGSLTKHLVKRVKQVVAVELDPNLAKNLSHHISAHSKTRSWKGELRVVEADILEFDLAQLPKGYKVVANIPYYLTSNLLRTLSESSNPPPAMTLLVQKEVAERIC